MLIEEGHHGARLSHPNVVSVLDLARDAEGWPVDSPAVRKLELTSAPPSAALGLWPGLNWGVRNWLDLGGELAITSLGEAFYERASRLPRQSFRACHTRLYGQCAARE
jgi:hypothetical protein